jgi:hypothetical protein
LDSNLEEVVMLKARIGISENSVIQCDGSEQGMAGGMSGFWYEDEMDVA